ncbi:hypothetical protein D9619_003668 [Psilocybe cf. subviscida]|uniref:Carboxypeptidase n=1 Tax=Psilocybe cf. subviscida TaxID=2480587 RepID=A0A8H5EV53_9AGAR|nr:hypothetical protein D9619_003668 [Psilocybe cf. subviscida]
MLFAIKTFATALLVGVVPSLARQQTFRNETDAFQPFGDTLNLPDSLFVTVGHPLFPHYGLRIKRSTDFCDSTVTSYTGYIDIEARHLFFYFFESRSDPDSDDVIYWTNGGPGSSALGLFMELGPCRTTENGTVFHPESWNNNANLLIVDQPIGVGFSYADHGETVSSSEEAAKDIAALLAIFFENFTKYKGRALHMAGESYAGRYIPLFAAEVYDQNTKLVAAGLTPINLQSIMLGNGRTDMYTMLLSYYNMACTTATATPVVDIASCIRMKQVLPRCKKALKESCVDIFDAIACRAASWFCGGEFIWPYFKSGRNPYDVSKMCEGEYMKTLCYPDMINVSKYLDRPEIRLKLGVDPSITRNFSSAEDFDVIQAFLENMDEWRPAQYHVAALLERGIRVLVYVGKNDFACNHVGNKAWIDELEWSGRDDFARQPTHEWLVDGKAAGVTKGAHGLTFTIIDGAGHMAPYDKPKECLDMLNHWITETPL